MSGVFISYARADQALAWRVTRWLRSLDVHVWWDQDMTSVDWHYELVDRITDLAAVIVIWSPNSSKSKSVRDEARLADDQGKLVNLLFGMAKPLHPFDRITGVSLDDWAGPQSNALSARITGSVEPFLVAAGALEKGALLARQAAQYADFQGRETGLSDIETELAGAEAAAKGAVDLIDTESAALAEVEADLANVKVSGLSKNIAAAAEAAARTEREAAEGRLRAARDAADTAMKRAATLARKRDKVRDAFDLWQAERGGPQTVLEAATPPPPRSEPAPPPPAPAPPPPAPAPVPPPPPPPPPPPRTGMNKKAIVVAAVVGATFMLILLAWIGSAQRTAGTMAADNAADAVSAAEAGDAAANATDTAADAMVPATLVDDIVGRTWGLNGDCTSPVTFSAADGILTMTVSISGLPAAATKTKIGSAGAGQIETDDRVYTRDNADAGLTVTSKTGTPTPFGIKPCP